MTASRPIRNTNLKVARALADVGLTDIIEVSAEQECLIRRVTTEAGLSPHRPN